MTEKRRANDESLEFPAYLSTSRNKQTIDISRTSRSREVSRKCFPTQKNGISADAPIEFQTKNSLVAKSNMRSVLVNDPAVKQEPPQKILTKGLIKDWPLKFIYTNNIDHVVPHKFETKSVKPQEVYDCILDQKKTIQRPDMVVGEDSFYNDKYYESAKENKAFHRKNGYLQNFAQQNKTTADYYKVHGKEVIGHTRFEIRPLMVTTVNSRNNLSFQSGNEHSKLLQNIKERGNISMQISSKSKSHLEEKEVLSKIQQEDTEHDKIFREFEEVDKVNKRSSITRLKKTIAHIEFKEEKAPEEEKRSRSVLPQRRPQSSFHLVRNLSAAKPEANISFYNSGQRIKDITKLVSHQREKNIKLDYSSFLKHDISVDNKRNDEIEVSVLEHNKTFSRRNNGTPLRYMSTPPQRRPERNDNLAKFEKHITRLKSNNKNFGHQRWFYNKNWKLGKVDLFETPNQSAVDIAMKE